MRDDKQISKSHITVIKESQFFDEAYYLEQNPDIKTSNIDPAEHYLSIGGFEGRNPSADFDSLFYLEQHQDVKESGINPLLHYMLYGMAEHRLMLAVDDASGGETSPPQKKLHAYPLNMMENIETESIRVRFYDQSLKRNSFGHSIAHWEPDIQDFWRSHLDRYYEFFILPRKIKKGNVLDVGAEFYNKHIKEVIAANQKLTIVDIKNPNHPEIQMIRNLDGYQKFDMTEDCCRDHPHLAGVFDTALSYGVLSYYDFTTQECATYIDNMAGFLKADGLAVFKIDQHAILRNIRLPLFPELHAMICKKFIITELDILTDLDQQYFIYYCKKNK